MHTFGSHCTPPGGNTALTRIQSPHAWNRQAPPKPAEVVKSAAGSIFGFAKRFVGKDEAVQQAPANAHDAKAAEPTNGAASHQVRPGSAVPNQSCASFSHQGDISTRTFADPRR